MDAFTEAMGGGRMRQRTMDEMVTYFNQQVSKMDIDVKYKMQLLGMIAAIECENERSEPKTGRWIHHDDKAYAGGGYEECSCCKWRCSEWIFIEDSHYCPNCGCRMMEVDNG